MNVVEFGAVLWTLRQAITKVEARNSISERDSLLATVLCDIWGKLDGVRLEMAKAEAEATPSHPSDEPRPIWIRVDRIEKRLDEIERKAKIVDEQIGVLNRIENWKAANVKKLSDMPLDPMKPIGATTHKAMDDPTTEEQLEGTLAEATAMPDTNQAEPETAEILADPELMASIRRGEADVKAGRVQDQVEAFAELDAEECGAATKQPAPPSNAQLREWSRKSPENRPPDYWWSATDDPFTAEPAPPIEVEMRCDGHPQGGWTWQICLMGIWVMPQCYSDNETDYVLFETEPLARKAGNVWLTALNEQLGVTFVAKWKGASAEPSPEPTPPTAKATPVQFDFSDALVELRAGKRVRRLDWGPALQWIELQTFVRFPCKRLIKVFTTKAPDESWLPSPPDILGTDWVVVAEEKPCPPPASG